MRTVRFLIEPSDHAHLVVITATTQNRHFVPPHKIPQTDQTSLQGPVVFTDSLLFKLVLGFRRLPWAIQAFYLPL